MFYRRPIWHLVYFISQFWISKVHFDFHWLFDISSSHIQIVMNIRFYIVTRCYEPEVLSPTLTFVTMIFELSRYMNPSRTWCHEDSLSRTCICSSPLAMTFPLYFFQNKHHRRLGMSAFFEILLLHCQLCCINTAVDEKIWLKLSIWKRM